jgi:2-polyprenyl-3-methyl-5-hydroxy-6-metoxy-1,4-benzoquinol methylase
MKPRIVIGLPMYQDVSPENKIDSMRMMYNFGRRYGQYDFFIAWKTKAEQFRARNYIVNKAREVDADFLLFLDDDQIIDLKGGVDHKPYMFLHTLLQHMEDDPEIGIVGALYFHRGGYFKSVLMHDREGIGVFYDDHEIENRLQYVDIQGGGVMLLRMKMFDKMEEPYFKPETLEDETRQGTDLQICRAARELGWKVACDTSIIVGHEFSERIVVGPHNRHLLIQEAQRKSAEAITYELESWQKMVMDDLVEYLGEDQGWIEIHGSAEWYSREHRSRFDRYSTSREYYISIGPDQACRQVMYHRQPGRAAEDASIVNLLRTPKKLHGLDYGCGIGVLGFEALRLGHTVDFVDIVGTEAFEFLQYRVKKHGYENKVSYKEGGPYDFVLMFDIIEHVMEWECLLDNVVGRMNLGAALLTNFFSSEINIDDPEHFHIDRKGVSDFLIKRGFMPSHLGLWIKRDNFLGGPKNVRNQREDDDNRKGEAVG